MYQEIQDYFHKKSLMKYGEKPIGFKLIGELTWALFVLMRDSKFKYYKIMYGINMGGHRGISVPRCGKGKYYSVYSQGSVIRIVSENDSGKEIILVPYQPNHGVMVNYVKDGKIRSCTSMSFEDFRKNGFAESEGELIP